MLVLVSDGCEKESLGVCLVRLLELESSPVPAALVVHPNVHLRPPNVG